MQVFPIGQNGHWSKFKELQQTHLYLRPESVDCLLKCADGISVHLLEVSLTYLIALASGIQHNGSTFACIGEQ